MNPKILIGGIGAIVLLIVLLPFLGGGGDSAPATQTQQGDRPSPTPDSSPRSVMQTTPQAAPQAPAAPAPNVPNLTARDLENTTWQIQGFPVQLMPNGVAQANLPGLGQVQGTWNVSGNQLNVSAMGQSESVEIRGNQLFARGQQVQRVR
jgi:hypothetical protein